MGRNNLVGAWGEALAADYLRRKRFEVVAAGFRSRFGEIDLIVKDRRYLVFVEVKYRADNAAGNPLEAVTAAKQRTISKVASYYCLTHGYGTYTPCRFDVAAILDKQIKVIQNAFDYQGF